MDATTKTMMIKEALCRGEFLTSLSAYKLCRTTRLAAIIHNLRNQGMPIVMIMRESSDGNMYGEYHLDTSSEYNPEV